ncbi:unnamed protein product [Staurois parvus]|uniref:Uncharacterized protein n=1 Tax=Staurois parvus TaxID=386267 RepID=A0ABN9BK99_9NEOB|nr:unnamed protein product [Staurois parvus]
MLLARPVICHGHPVPPPNAAARPVIFLGPPFRLLMLLPGTRNLSWAPVPPPSCCCQVQRCVMGPWYGLPLWQARAVNLPWAPAYLTPHAAARPVICHGPVYRLLHAAMQVQQCVIEVPVRPPFVH